MITSGLLASVYSDCTGTGIYGGHTPQGKGWGIGFCFVLFSQSWRFLCLSFVFIIWFCYVAFKSREAKVCAYGVNCKLDVSTIMAFGQLKRVGFKKKKKKKNLPTQSSQSKRRSGRNTLDPGTYRCSRQRKGRPAGKRSFWL